jgi:hypothetical protein
MDALLHTQTSTALLPSLLWQQGWLAMGWSVVVAGIGGWWVRRWTPLRSIQALVTSGLALWVLVPGVWGGSHWLGLAFQAPSVTTVLLCGYLCGRVLLRPSEPHPLRKAWTFPLLFWVTGGVVLGWALLLDTLGVFPGSFYQWGFGAAAPAVALTVAALPWIFAKNAFPYQGATVLAIAMVFFLVSRLPTGNLFDAIMDPGLWFYLLFALIQQWRYRSHYAPN